ncbi:hypothetical protein EDD17DRAFT_1750092 [Pisolithus thermaeus]|nr:hypothetical protein EDD17DRAFT_1750092 [Pisolithus thermaeus]
MPPGHPKKRQRTHNIMGLKGQYQPASSTGARSSALSDKQPSNPHLFILEIFKFNVEEGYTSEQSSDESDVDEEVEWDLLENEELCERMIKMMEREDAGWLPECLQQKRERCMKAHKSHPKTYVKGPDVMISISSEESHISISASLQSCHASPGPTSKQKCQSTAPSEDLDEPYTNSDTSDLGLKSVDEGSCGSGMDGDLEEWEEELDSTLVGHGEICDWKILHDQIKEDLKKYKSLPLSDVNQLMILSNFATLRLKGASHMAASFGVAQQWYTGEGSGAWCARCICMLARHYQLFEQLPQEKRGGRKNAQSFLHDESVQTRCQMWLSNQPTGQVTPHAFWEAIKSTIFPELGILPKHPISEWTAR